MLRSGIKLLKSSKTQTSPLAVTQNKRYYGQQQSSLDKLKEEIDESKKMMKWRTEAANDPSIWKSKLTAFEFKEQNSDFITMMQQPVDLSIQGAKDWWKSRQEKMERHMQQFIPERHAILGNDLAAAHFVVHRGGSVKFAHERTWTKQDDIGDYKLPTTMDPKYKVEAIKFDGMILYYEGLENIRYLLQLKFMSFHNVKSFDDWCLDRLSGGQFPVLDTLDLSGTSVTERGLNALYRMKNLKFLIVDDPKKDLPFELACAVLEEENPNLKVYSVEQIHS
ncbi:ATP5SL family protein [Megaselia abdita]